MNVGNVSSVNNCKLKINSFIMPELYYISNRLLQIIHFAHRTSKDCLYHAKAAI